MAFIAVGVYDLDGLFLGYSIKDESVDKLQSTNLWTEEDVDLKDINQQLRRLNDAVDIRAHWPDIRDPEVQRYINDPNFYPLKMSAVEVEDVENSQLIWLEEPDDIRGTPGILDVENSVIAYKMVEAPAPADVGLRNKTACEIVARHRATSSVAQ